MLPASDPQAMFCWPQASHLLNLALYTYRAGLHTYILCRLISTTFKIKVGRYSFVCRVRLTEKLVLV